MFIVFINNKPKKGAFACLLVFLMYSAVNGLTSASCEALAEFRFWHLGQHFVKPGDFEDISVSRILHFIQSAELLNS
jgi:hypothetical protein